MVGTVRKTFGEIPVDLIVGSVVVSFNAEGIAIIEDPEVLAIFGKIPGYVVTKAIEPSIPLEPGDASDIRLVFSKAYLESLGEK